MNSQQESGLPIPIVAQPPESNLIACVYLCIQCKHCGDIRQALSHLPASETLPCPECGLICAFTPLGTGLTRKALPFHEVHARANGDAYRKSWIIRSPSPP